MTSLHRLAAGALAVCAIGVAAPAASADSIAYIKDGNVWLATPDGTRQVPVTTTGGYTDVTQADDGTLVGLNGVRLHRMDRSGKVLADFDTPVSTNGPTGSFSGPFNPMLSPDGTKLSYTYFYNTTTQDPSCRPPVCVVKINEGGTGYSHADRQTGWDEPGLGRHSGWLYSTWLDNDTTVLGYPTHLPNADVIVDTISDGSQGNLVHNWFTDRSEGNPMVGAGDITRDGRKFAQQSGASNETISVYAVPSFPRAFKDGEADPSTLPTVCYRYTGPNGGRYSQPTFSANGSGLAWAEGDGIHVAAVPDFSGGCTTAGATPTAPLVLAGGSEPDWGPADVPAAAPVPQPMPGPGPAPARLTVKVKSAKLRAALKHGLKVTVDVAAPARVSASAKAGRKVVAKAAGKQLAAGKRTITLKFTKAARKSLARKKTAKLAIDVNVGGAKAAATATLKR
jgi:hypothetical protein